MAGAIVLQKSSPDEPEVLSYTFFNLRADSNRIKSGNMPRTGGGGKTIPESCLFKFAPLIGLMQATPKDGKRCKILDMYKSHNSISGVFAESYVFGLDSSSDKLLTQEGENAGVETTVLIVQLSDLYVAELVDIERVAKKSEAQKGKLRLKLEDAGVTSHLIFMMLYEHISTTMNGQQRKSTASCVNSLLTEDGTSFSKFLSIETHDVKVFSDPGALSNIDKGKLARLLACRFRALEVLLLTEMSLLVLSFLLLSSIQPLWTAWARVSI
jgi:hypothetical protein